MKDCREYITRIPEYLKRTNLSHQKIAEKFDVSKASIHRWNRCNEYPPIKVLLQLSSDYNTNISYLLGATDIDCPNETDTLNLDLTACLESVGITSNELAKRLKTNPVIVKEYLTAPRYSRVHTLLAMAEALDVSIDYLLGLTSVKKWEQIALQEDPFFLCNAGQSVYLYACEKDSSNSAEGYALIHADGKRVIFPTGRIVDMQDDIFQDVYACPAQVLDSDSLDLVQNCIEQRAKRKGK